MKGALLLSKRDDFDRLVEHYASRARHGSVWSRGSNSAVIHPDDEYRLYLFNLDPWSDDDARECEIPEWVLAQQYRYAYSVECRSESLFCEIIGSTPPEFDILILDTDGVIFRPSELRADTLSL
jgi:hypothetical protein